MSFFINAGLLFKFETTKSLGGDPFLTSSSSDLYSTVYLVVLAGCMEDVHVKVQLR